LPTPGGPRRIARQPEPQRLGHGEPPLAIRRGRQHAISPAPISSSSPPDEAEVLFTLMAERYERRSLVITSNLVFSEWDRIFKNR